MNSEGESSDKLGCTMLRSKATANGTTRFDRWAQWCTEPGRGSVLFHWMFYSMGIGVGIGVGAGVGADVCAGVRVGMGCWCRRRRGSRVGYRCHLICCCLPCWL